jgi:hypothetical protein
MVKPTSWTKRTRYHVIDALGTDCGNYANKKTALGRAAEMDAVNKNTAPWLTDREIPDVAARQPHKVEKKITHKGNCNRIDIIRPLAIA